MATQMRKNRTGNGGLRRGQQAGTGSNPHRGSVRRRLHPRSVLAVLVSLSLASSLAVAVPALAEPDTGGDSETSLPQPTTSEQAKKAWLEASEKAEAANEDLLTAQEHEKDAKAAAADAKIEVARASLAASSAESVAVQASARYAEYRQQLAAFASASFRGARLGQLSALLTAESSSDYLDEVSSLDHVAGKTKALMAKALDAKKQADAAADRADDAQQQAVSAQAKADAALSKAQQATKTVQDRKKDLEARVKKYHQLFSSLSAAEREAAMDAQQAAWEQQARQAQEQALTPAQQQRAREQAEADARADEQGVPKAGSDADANAGDSLSDAPAKARKAVKAALTKLGNAYVYGARGPNVFDCSGLTSWAWAQAGVKIPRTSSAQSRLKSVPLDQLRPGDLVTYYSPVHHVAMYIGNGQIIQASTETKPIYITSLYRGGPYPSGHRPY